MRDDDELLLATDGITRGHVYVLIVATVVVLLTLIAGVTYCGVVNIEKDRGNVARCLDGGGTWHAGSCIFPRGR